MTGPEHYREAERLLAQVDGGEHDYQDAPLVLGQAQVHATLALVAAQAEPIVQESLGTENVDLAMAWSEAIS